MTWLLNEYTCERCGQTWEDTWSCMCGEDCSHCGARHIEPNNSTDLTEIVREIDGNFVVYVSPPEAEDEPKYRALKEFPTSEEAKLFLLKRQESA